MMRPFILILLLTALLATAAPPTRASEIPLNKDSYLRARADLIELDRSFRRSADLQLTDRELRAAEALERLKQPWDSLATWLYPPAHRFHEVRAAYASSRMLEVMDQLPKGAMLHAHPSATGSFENLIEATRQPYVWVYQGPDSSWLPTGKLTWAEEAPSPLWKRAIDLRKAAADSAEFDRKLMESITLGLEDYDKGDIWSHFENNFTRMWDLAAQPHVWKPHMINGCRELAEQGVQHVEFHTWVGPSLQEDGSMGSAEDNLATWLEIRDSVRVDYPHFDLKLIGATTRWNSVDRVRDYLRTVVELKQRHPDLIVGYDLVSEEDKTGTNLHFLDALLSAHQYADSLGVELRPCIHSGESNRLDNENLYDAFLLKAKRLGHAYGLWRHPALMERALEEDVAIEVCPISNQALGYVVDLRNHPAVEYIARGIPVVLSPDDPGMMRYRWAYDWVAATSAWDLSLADLKQLILDSFEYSGYSDEERAAAVAVWEKDWQAWVEWLASEY